MILVINQSTNQAINQSINPIVLVVWLVEGYSFFYMYISARKRREGCDINRNTKAFSYI